MASPGVLAAGAVTVFILNAVGGDATTDRTVQVAAGPGGTAPFTDHYFLSRRPTNMNCIPFN